MTNPFSSRLLSEMTAEDLKKRETSLKAVTYVAGGFILVT